MSEPGGGLPLYSITDSVIALSQHDVCRVPADVKYDDHFFFATTSSESHSQLSICHEYRAPRSANTECSSTSIIGPIPPPVGSDGVLGIFQLLMLLSQGV